MTPSASLLAELRLLRAMGQTGRAAAAAALRSARLSATPGEDDEALKLMVHELDAAIVQRGGKSIFAAKPVGELSAEANKRFARWAFETPQRHPDAGGPKPRPQVAKPGRLVGTLIGKLGGYASDRDGDEG